MWLAVDTWSLPHINNSYRGLLLLVRCVIKFYLSCLKFSLLILLITFGIKKVTWHLKSNLRKSSTKLLSYYQKYKKSMSVDWFRKKYICNLKEIFCLQKFLLEEVIYTLIKFDFFNSLLCFGDWGKGRE